MCIQQHFQSGCVVVLGMEVVVVVEMQCLTEGMVKDRPATRCPQMHKLTESSSRDLHNQAMADAGSLFYADQKMCKASTESYQSCCLLLVHGALLRCHP